MPKCFSIFRYKSPVRLSSRKELVFVKFGLMILFNFERKFKLMHFGHCKNVSKEVRYFKKLIRGCMGRLSHLSIQLSIST